MNNKFPFCNDSIGLMLFYNDRIVSHTEVYFSERENTDIIHFSGKDYFRISRPYIKTEAIGIEKFCGKDLKKKKIKRFDCYRIVEKCIWLNVENTDFQEMLEYPYWTRKHISDAQGEANSLTEEAKKEAEEKKEVEKDKEPVDMTPYGEHDGIFTKLKYGARENIIKKLKNKFKSK